jgi:putative redox protein
VAVEITGRYIRPLKTELVHGPSGTTLRTAAPADNQGDGSSFSPTDLFATSLAACMVTTMAIVAERDGIDLSGLTFRVVKHMKADPRRLGALPVEIRMPAGIAAGDRAKLERAAHTCPVHRSLGLDVEPSVEFIYPD